MRGHQEETPLHHAAWGGHTEVVKLLIQYGADVNEKNVRAPVVSHCTVTGTNVVVISG
jgi:ankyrin repeat protein